MFGIQIIIALMVVTLVCAATAPFMWATAKAGSRRDALAKYVGGTAYCCLGTLGLMTFQFLHAHVLLSAIGSAAFIGLGVWMIQTGRKIMSALKQGKPTDKR
ncbi:MAG TPA: hypothetical protein V6C81_12525 [Planktothrix sp.]|jgi:hypothetical protein